MPSMFLESLSTYSDSIDNLILLIAVLVGFWFIACEVVFFWFIWKYKDRGQKALWVTGETPEQKKFINIPHMLVLACDVFIIIGAVMVWVDVKQTLPPADATIGIHAQQWSWTFKHPGADGKLGTPDDIDTAHDMFIEVGKTYHFKLTAEDVMHSFSVPVFRLKQDAIPGREITGWFKARSAGKLGVYDIQCAEMCGIGHGIMGARMHLQSREKHAAWMAKHAGSAPVFEAPAPVVALEAK
jgi:cytochrome c oxidase subunit II